MVIYAYLSMELMNPINLSLDCIVLMSPPASNSIIVTTDAVQLTPTGFWSATTYLLAAIER